ncbi:polysaccharide biosynthesis tyrosine autokinase [Thalassotalea ponticola]|uniref:GumC family protein n=1 Tax=Thalassotalea ponticola TaxID=1523392 RepID=UPI0025B3D3E5|nr:polysaccharide biosynthesis tyrosine autokinase [Thalassotalea ponticola]MDN3652634.1 polysaccharide biosynthesis tyrosine autokinase [Thalassotalea ponticola]
MNQQVPLHSTSPPDASHTAKVMQDHNDFDDIDFKQLFSVLMSHKWHILLFTLVVGLCAALYAYSLTPIYRATATMHLDAGQARVDDLQDVYQDTTASEEFYYTQLEIIRSTSVAEQVVKNLRLENNPIFRVDKLVLLERNPDLLTLSEQQLNERIVQMQYQSAVGFVQGGLSATPLKNTQLVNISFTSVYPHMTALVANALTQAYIDNHMQVSLNRIEKSAQWLNTSLAGLKAKLNQSQDALQAFRERESLVDIGGIKSLAANDVESLSTQLLQAKQTLKDIELVYQLTSKNTTQVTELATLPDVLNHPDIRQAIEQQRQAQRKLDNLALTYGKKHPKMIAAVAEVNRERANVQKNIESLANTIGSDYQKAQQTVSQLQVSLNNAKQQYQKLTRLDDEHRTLEQEVETNKQLYTSFFNRLQETAELQRFEANVARVIEPAVQPSSPIKPNKKLIVVIAMLTAAAAAVGAVLLLEALNSTIRSVDDVETKLHKSLLGIVPLIGQYNDKTRKDSNEQVLPASYYSQGGDSAFSESIRTLRTSLSLLSLEDNHNVVSITSSIPGEGKTTVAISLASALGQLHKTLLIDTDMRRPTVAKRFNLADNQPGLSNVIADTHSFEQCVHHCEQTNLDVLSAGHNAPNPQELLASNQFSQLLQTLRTRYDRIVIDTAPVQAVSDAMLVARLTDRHLYVVKADATKEAVVKAGLKRMSLAGVNVDGIVLNQVDLSKARQYQDFAGYYDHYGYAT